MKVDTRLELPLRLAQIARGSGVPRSVMVALHFQLVTGPV